MNDYHVMPIGDIREHSDTRDCACLPDREKQADGTYLVIHHSFDGRELKEGGDVAKRYKQVLDVRKLIGGTK